MHACVRGVPRVCVCMHACVDWYGLEMVRTYVDVDHGRREAKICACAFLVYIVRVEEKSTVVFIEYIYATTSCTNVHV